MAGRSWSGVSHPFMRPAGRPGVSPILDGALLIGEYPTPDDVVWLREEHGIEAVLSLQDDFDLAYKSLDVAALRRAYAGAGVEWHRFGITDGEPGMSCACSGLCSRPSIGFSSRDAASTCIAMRVSIERRPSQSPICTLIAASVSTRLTTGCARGGPVRPI